MSQIHVSSNSLLSTIVRFLNAKDVSIEKLQNLINESTTEQLVPSFAFLGFWLTSNLTSIPDPSISTNVQSAFHLIDLIIGKVPPVILLSGISDLNWGMNQPSWTLSEFFQSVFERIRKIRLFVKPFSLESHILRFPQTYVTGDKPQMVKFPGLLLEVEADPSYQMSCIQHFKRLILNHAPLEAFKPLIEHRNSRLILTYAIINLISTLNSDRNATHNELMFTFATIFLYVQGFASTNDIDGQILCEYLQSRTYISPFCMLAIVNHIPANSYLFNLLIPRQLTKGDIEKEEDAIAAIKNQYRIIDMSIDDTLTPFIRFIPSLLCRHFLSNFQVNYSKGIGTTQSDKIAFILLAGNSTIDHMKTIVQAAKDHEFGPDYVSAMSTQLMKIFTFSFQCTFYECCKNKMFTPSLMMIIEPVFTMLFPIHCDAIAHKFLHSANQNPLLSELTIRAIFSLVRIIAPLPTHKNMIPFLLKCISMGSEQKNQETCDLLNVSLVLLAKYLRAFPPRLTDNIVEKIGECRNIIVLLEYIEVTDNLTDVNLCTEYQKIADFRTNIISRMPFPSDSISPYVISYCPPSFSLSSMTSLFDDVSLSCFQAYIQMNGSFSPTEVLRRLHTTNGEEIALFLITTSLIIRHEFADGITRFVSELLVNTADIGHFSPGKDCQFVVSHQHVGLLIAQRLLPRLLSYRHESLAKKLIDDMIPVLVKDNLPLHWFTGFLKKHWKLLTPEISNNLLNRFIRQLPYSSEYLIESPDMIRAIGTKLDAIIKKVAQSPDVLNREYQSQFSHMKAFSICNILLRNYQSDLIVEKLVSPIFDNSKPWREKESCCLCLANVIADFPAQICIDFFIAVVRRMPSPTAMKAIRIFLVYVDLSVFRELCMSMKNIIGGDEIRLSMCLHMMMSSFMRLKGDQQAATSLLCGFLENVSASTKKELQEEVIDAVGLTYLTLKLHKSRPVLINAASRFPPEMKSIIASSLELTVQNRNQESIPYINTKVQNLQHMWN